jgi:thiamine-phosphate pyrophosphorylase
VRSLRPELDKVYLYGILDTGYLPLDQFEATAEKLIQGGVGMLQIRAKKESAETRHRLVERVLPVCLETEIPLIINDDLSVAMRHPEVGLHVGQDDLPVDVARGELGPDRIIGLSTHSEKQAGDAYAKAKLGLIDYFAVGPVFPTQTKPDYIPVTLDLVKWVVSQCYEVPHFFIGGINRKSLPALIETGAKRVVVVSDLLQAENPEIAATEILAQLRA